MAGGRDFEAIRNVATGYVRISPIASRPLRPNGGPIIYKLRMMLTQLATSCALATRHNVGDPKRDPPCWGGPC